MAAVVPVELLSPPVATYVQTGAAVGTIMRDVAAVDAQIPRVAWGLVAAGAAYVAYKRWRKHP